MTKVMGHPDSKVIVKRTFNKIPLQDNSSWHIAKMHSFEFLHQIVAKLNKDLYVSHVKSLNWSLPNARSRQGGIMSQNVLWTPDARPVTVTVEHTCWFSDAIASSRTKHNSQQSLSLCGLSPTQSLHALVFLWTTVLHSSETVFLVFICQRADDAIGGTISTISSFIYPFSFSCIYILICTFSSYVSTSWWCNWWWQEEHICWFSAPFPS